METINFMITGVGGQGTILASDILSAVGLAAGYDVKKSDILGLAVRGGAVMSHIRWGEKVHSPIIPEGRADYLLAFEILEGLRHLHQVQEAGHALINQQEIHPVTVSSGLADYPDSAATDEALESAVEHVYHVPGLQIAQEIGNVKVLNVALLGALSALLPVEASVWETVITERIPERFKSLNTQAFRNGRTWMQKNRNL